MARSIEKLPFDLERTDGAEANFWTVAATGNWVADLETGADFARAYANAAAATDSAPPLGWVIRDMTTRLPIG